MNICISILTIACAGAVGGIINALINDKGLILPKREVGDNGLEILRPGWVGNVIIGAVAAVISWGLYGPFADAVLKCCGNVPVTDMNLSNLVGAVLIGIGGARWLTDQVDKQLLRSTAVAAAGKQADPELAQKIALAPPPVAFRMSTKKSPHL